MIPALNGYTRYGLTWCSKAGELRAEISRAMNDETRLIEWHVLVWRGTDRDAPTVDAFTGQDLDDAVFLAQKGLRS